MIPVFAVWLAACGRPTVEAEVSAVPSVEASATPAAPSEAAPASAWTPTDEQASMITLLSMRDGPAPCAQVEAASHDPIDDLVAIVDHVTMPPSAPMAAAGCLVVGHAEAVEPTIAAWMTDPHTKGLALLAAGHLDVMPRPVAVRIAGVGLAGPYAEDVRRRILAASDPEIQALGEVRHDP